jgi:hypothetical protein
VTLHTKIRGRFTVVDEDGKPYSKIYETTPGRHAHRRTSAEERQRAFDVCNQEMTKKNISKMIDTVYRHAVRRTRSSSATASCSSASATPAAPAFRSARTTWSSRKQGEIVGDTESAGEGIRAAVQ